MSPLLKRILLVIPTLLLVSMGIFSLLAILPGDPVTAILGLEATPEAALALRAQLGLDDPLYLQYAHWLWGVLHGDLGRSFIDRTPVMDVLMQRLPASWRRCVRAASPITSARWWRCSACRCRISG